MTNNGQTREDLVLELKQRHLVNDLEHALDSAPSKALTRSDVPAELLERPTPSGLVLMVVQEWVMILGLSVAVFYVPIWLYPVIALLLAGRYHALGVILHDATHMPLRNKSPAIRFVEVFAGYPIATTLNAMRYHHLRHHRDSGMHTDPYYKSGKQNILWWILNTVRGVALVPFWNLRAVVGGFSFLVPGLRNIYGHIFLQDRSDADLRQSTEIRDCARAEWGQIIFLSIMILMVMRYPVEMTACYLLPVSVAGLLAARRLLLEHNYIPISDRKIETIITTTNDNHLGIAGSLFLAPRNIGYHIVHHIHPQVRLGALPGLRDWYLRTHPELYIK